MSNQKNLEGVYIKLFHGRQKLREKMDDWGTQGPVFGPFEFVHTTYGCDLKMLYAGTDRNVELFIKNDMVYYDGVYYGDWSVFSADMFNSEPELQARLAPLVEGKAKK